MAKKQQDPSLEIFANIRTILAFVVLGSAIVAFVEYHSSSSADKTYDRWKTATLKKEEKDSYLNLVEFNNMISGYPTVKKIEVKKIPKEEEEKKKKTGKKIARKKKNAKIKPEKEKAPETAPVSTTNPTKVSTVNMIYTWKGPFTKSFVTVQMSDRKSRNKEDDDNKENSEKESDKKESNKTKSDDEIFIFRISPIQH